MRTKLEIKKMLREFLEKNGIETNAELQEIANILENDYLEI